VDQAVRFRIVDQFDQEKYGSAALSGILPAVNELQWAGGHPNPAAANIGHDGFDVFICSSRYP
jgi:hypothetical protein